MLYDARHVSGPSRRSHPLSSDPDNSAHQNARANDTSLSSDQGRRGVGVILEVGLNDLLGLVIPRQSVDSTLDENQAEFGVLVFSVDFQVFAHGDGLFYKVVQVFRDGGCEAC